MEKLEERKGSIYTYQSLREFVASLADDEVDKVLKVVSALKNDREGKRV